MSSSKTILILAGGSGGHVIPALSLGRALKNRGYTVHYAADQISTNLFFSKNEFPCTDISSKPLSSLKTVLPFFLGLTKGSIDSYRLIQSLSCSVVIGFGSYHTVSGLLGALLCRVPVILHEANVIPGRVTRLFSKQATAVGCFFQQACDRFIGSNTSLVDIPLRQEIMNAASLDRRTAHRRYGLNPDFPTILVLGGSQGARSMNQLIPDLSSAFLKMLRQQSSDPGHTVLQVLHLAGNEREVERVKKLYESSDPSIRVEIRAYEPEMQMAYRAADIVIGRSGASTIAELFYLNIPSLLIPYPFAKDNHQLENAKAYQALWRDGVCYIEEKELNVSAVEYKENVERAARMLFNVYRSTKSTLFLPTREPFVDLVERIIG